MRDDKTVIRPAPALYGLKNSNTLEIIELRGEMTVGRQQDCAIELLEGHVSRVHAKITVSGVDISITDNQSTNGTFVNDKKIDTVSLAVGDKIKFDIYEFEITSLIPEVVDVNKTQFRPPASTPTDSTQPEEAPQVSSVQQTESIPEKLNEPPQPEKSELEAQKPDSANQNRTQVWVASEQADTGTVILNGAAQAIQQQDAGLNSDNETLLYGFHPLVNGKTYSLVKSSYSLGKSPLSDIIVADGSVSSNHAVLNKRGDSWLLSDLNSTNGTYVNGTEINKDQALTPGDLLQIGLIQFVFAQPTPREVKSAKTKWFVALVATLILAVAGFLAFHFVKQPASDKASLTTVWEQRLPAGRLYRFFSSTDSQVVTLGTTNNVLVMDNQNGQILEQAQVVEGICDALHTNNNLVVLTHDGSLNFMRNGLVVNSVKIAGSRMLANCSLAIDGHANALQLVASHSQGFLVYDLTSQKKVYEEKGEGISSVLIDQKGNQQPLMIIKAHFNGLIENLKYTAGSIISRDSSRLHTNDSLVSLHRAGANVLAFNSQGELVLYSGNTLNVIWKTNYALDIGEVAVATDRIFVASKNGKISSLSLADGSVLAILQLNVAVESVIFVDSSLFVFTSNNRVHQLSASLVQKRINQFGANNNIVVKSLQDGWISIANSGVVLRNAVK